MHSAGSIAAALEVGRAREPVGRLRFPTRKIGSSDPKLTVPPSPGVIRTTANNRFDNQLPRAAVAIDAATTLGTSADPIYPLTLIASLTVAAPPTRAHSRREALRATAARGRRDCERRDPQQR